MATLEDFLRTGHLGPVILGITPNDVMTALGEPTHTSMKSNPLQLKYGSVQLSFWKTSNRRKHELREIAIIYQPQFESLPHTLEFTDWNPAEPPTQMDFSFFLHTINYLPVHQVQGPHDLKMSFLSGVTALFTDAILHSIRLHQRNTKEATSLPLSDEREPTTEQILDMFDEAIRVMNIHAYGAALLIAWAGLEATLRRTALKAGRQGKIGIQPSILIRELFAAGQLTPEDHSFLEELRQLRTTFAHGLAPMMFDKDKIRKIIELSKRLLSDINSN